MSPSEPEGARDPLKKRGRPAKGPKPSAQDAAMVAGAESSARRVPLHGDQTRKEVASVGRGREPRSRKAAASPEAMNGTDPSSSTLSPPKKARKGRSRKGDDAVSQGTAVSTERLKDAAAPTSAGSSAVPKSKRPPLQRATIPRGLTPRLEDGPPVSSPSSSSSSSRPRRRLRLLSWNVAGLRGLLKKGETAAEAFRSLLLRERPDVLCLQETKLQEEHVAEVAAALRELHLPMFEGNWHCSTAKKGYSGTSVLISESAGLAVGPGGVTCGMEGEGDGEGEGRVISVDLGAFTLVNVYTPNSGEGLRRLAFRTQAWDRAFERHLEALQGAGDGNRAVLCCGDLNVAHLDADFYNPGEARMAKAAGTTPEERASFGRLLEGAGMVDSFRHYHPDVTGCYSYWSMRAGNRPYNRGMRLDYFLASKNMLRGGDEGGGVPRLLDSFILDQDPAVSKLSDHAPVGVLLEV